MNTYLKSIGYVKTTLETGGTIWDSLVTIISNIIYRENLNDIDTEILCKKFEEFFGKKIPLHK